MRLMDAIQTADSLKPNAFVLEQKLVWLNELEGKIQTLIHGIKPVTPTPSTPPEDESEAEQTPSPASADEEQTLIQYALPEDEETQLLAPAPYDGLYWKHLCAMIDYANGEYDKYAASQKVANAAYMDYAKWYIRTHPYQPSEWRCGL